MATVYTIVQSMRKLDLVTANPAQTAIDVSADLDEEVSVSRIISVQNDLETSRQDTVRRDAEVKTRVEKTGELNSRVNLDKRIKAAMRSGNNGQVARALRDIATDIEALE